MWDWTGLSPKTSTAFWGRRLRVDRPGEFNSTLSLQYSNFACCWRPWQLQEHPLLELSAFLYCKQVNKYMRQLPFLYHLTSARALGEGHIIKESAKSHHGKKTIPFMECSMLAESLIYRLPTVSIKFINCKQPCRTRWCKRCNIWTHHVLICSIDLPNLWNINTFNISYTNFNKMSLVTIPMIPIH